MRILVIIVTYNGSKWVDKCFGSLRTSTIPLEVIAIDNGSTDHTVSLLKDGYPEVEVVEPKANLGFGRANNVGLKKVLDEKMDYAFLLNQDAWIKPDTIENMVAFSKVHPEYGILSPIHLNGSGTNIDPKFGAALFRHNRNFLDDLYFGNKQLCYDAKYVNAALWLLPLQTLEDIGGFNPDYFMYGEDSDYIMRVLYHKKKLGVLTNCEAFHARDNHHYKKLPFFKNLKFQTQEWYHWSYEEFMMLNRNLKQGIWAAYHRIWVSMLNKIYKHDYSGALGSQLGFFKFLFKLRKAKKTKEIMIGNHQGQFLKDSL